MLTVRPKAWKFGRTVKNESLSDNVGMASNIPRHWSSRFAWVMGTALGSPVVPEVEKMTARSSVSGSAGRPVRAGGVPSVGNRAQDRPASRMASVRLPLTPSETTTAKG